MSRGQLMAAANLCGVAVQIFCQVIVLMNFYALENLYSFVDLGLKISD